MEEKIEKKSDEIRNIILKVDELIEESNFEVKSENKNMNKKIDSINEKYINLKNEIESLE